MQWMPMRSWASSSAAALADVTDAVRQKAKVLHPDANQGDRSSEPELRRISRPISF